MKITRSCRALAALFALATVGAGAGCDWLETSGSGARVSPMINGLSVSPRNVFCGTRNKLQIAFGYTDPQDDISQVLLRFEQPRAEERISRTLAWTDLDLASSPGRAIYRDFFFSCDDPSGDWTVTVRVDDERGHESNQLSTVVTLVSSR